MTDQDKFAEKLIKSIQDETLKLPTQPEVAVRLRECAEDPNLDAKKLAHVIGHDPALTAKFIQIANSPLSRGAVPINSLPDVINRLGIRIVCNLATGLAMEQIFQATNENIDKLMFDAWSSSTYVAAYAHVLAKNYSTIPSDVASLGGLMHQIGVLPILSYFQDDDEVANDLPFLKHIICEHHALIGEKVLKSWQFPEEIYSLPKKLNDENQPQEKSQLIYVIQAALIKTKDDHKNFIEFKSPSDDAFKQLKVDKDELTHNQKFNTDLQEAVKFYCQLQ